MKILKMVCILLLVFIFARFAFIFIHDIYEVHRIRNHAKNYQSIQQVIESAIPVTQISFFEKDSKKYVWWELPIQSYYPSGPPVYIFDIDGNLCDYSTDIGDDPAFINKWKEVKGKQEVSLFELIQRYYCDCGVYNNLTDVSCRGCPSDVSLPQNKEPNDQPSEN